MNNQGGSEREAGRRKSTSTNWQPLASLQNDFCMLTIIMIITLIIAKLLLKTEYFFYVFKIGISFIRETIIIVVLFHIKGIRNSGCFWF